MLDRVRGWRMELKTRDEGLSRALNIQWDREQLLTFRSEGGTVKREKRMIR